MPALRLVAPQGRSLVLYLRPLVEHARHRGVPRLPAQLDFNTVSVVYPLVSTFRLVCAVMKHSKQKYESRHRT